MMHQLFNWVVDWWPYILSAGATFALLCFLLLCYYFFSVARKQGKQLALMRNYVDAQSAEARQTNEKLERIAAALEKHHEK